MPLINRWTDDADSVPGLVPLRKMACEDENDGCSGSQDGWGEVTVPEIVAKAVGITDLVVWSIANVEHEVRVQMSER